MLWATDLAVMTAQWENRHEHGGAGMGVGPLAARTSRTPSPNEGHRSDHRLPASPVVSSFTSRPELLSLDHFASKSAVINQKRSQIASNRASLALELAILFVGPPCALQDVRQHLCLLPMTGCLQYHSPNPQLLQFRISPEISKHPQGSKNTD